MARSLSGDDLDACFARYDEVIRELSSRKKQKKGNPSLVQLDSWYQNELYKAVNGRKPRYMQHSELVKLMKWKLMRGKFRPRLQDLVEGNSEEQVEMCSKKAFRLLPDLRKSISALTELKGVGPATASAILAAGSPEVAPFMADETVEAVCGGGKVEYTLKAYLEYADRLKSLVVDANESRGRRTEWTPHTMELALWCRAQITKLNLEHSSQKQDSFVTGKEGTTT